jgi:hypothetical protein
LFNTGLPKGVFGGKRGGKDVLAKVARLMLGLAQDTYTYLAKLKHWWRSNTTQTQARYSEQMRICPLNFPRTTKNNTVYRDGTRGERDETKEAKEL